MADSNFRQQIEPCATSTPIKLIALSEISDGKFKFLDKLAIKAEAQDQFRRSREPIILRASPAGGESRRVAPASKPLFNAALKE
jgi:hypothetical protein